jgi:hypothetical protein
MQRSKPELRLEFLGVRVHTDSMWVQPTTQFNQSVRALEIPRASGRPATHFRPASRIGRTLKAACRGNLLFGDNLQRQPHSQRLLTLLLYCRRTVLRRLPRSCPLHIIGKAQRWQISVTLVAPKMRVWRSRGSMPKLYVKASPLCPSCHDS